MAKKTDDKQAVDTAKPKKRTFRKSLKAHKWSILKSRWFKFLIVLLLIFGSIFAIVKFSTNGAVNTANEFLADLQSNNAGATYALFTDSAQANVPEDQFPDALTKLSSVLTGEPKLTSKSVTNSLSSDSTARVTYEIHGSDGKIFDIAISLVKQGGSWKVLNFNSTPRK